MAPRRMPSKRWTHVERRGSITHRRCVCSCSRTREQCAMKSSDANDCERRRPERRNAAPNMGELVPPPVRRDGEMAERDIATASSGASRRRPVSGEVAASTPHSQPAHRTADQFDHAVRAYDKSTIASSRGGDPSGRHACGMPRCLGETHGHEGGEERARVVRGDPGCGSYEKKSKHAVERASQPLASAFVRRSSVVG